MSLPDIPDNCKASVLISEGRGRIAGRAIKLMNEIIVNLKARNLDVIYKETDEGVLKLVKEKLNKDGFSIAPVENTEHYHSYIEGFKIVLP